MYALRDDKTGQFVATSRSRAAAHRTSRTRRHLGMSVNRAGGRSHLYHTFASTPVGGQFWFEREGGARSHSLGPWIKVSDRQYRHDDDAAGKWLYTISKRSVRVTYRDPNANRAGGKVDYMVLGWGTREGAIVVGPFERKTDAIEEAKILSKAKKSEFTVASRDGYHTVEVGRARGGVFHGGDANRAGAKSKVSKEAVAFFLKNAGSSYPVGARPAQKRAAKLAAARDLAEAEAEAERRGWKMIWEDDPEGWDSLGDIDPDEIKEVLSARVEDEDGKVLASLGSITFAKGSTHDADRRYGRVVEAELAQEALGV